MAKAPHVSIDDAFEDFGFSAVGEEELKQAEQQLKEEVKQTRKKLLQKEESDKTYKARMERMYKMIIPLLNNLKKNPDKEYILWPNRVEKIDDFIAKLDALFEEEQ